MTKDKHETITIGELVTDFSAADFPKMFNIDPERWKELFSQVKNNLYMVNPMGILISIRDVVFNNEREMIAMVFSLFMANFNKMCHKIIHDNNGLQLDMQGAGATLIFIMQCLKDGNKEVLESMDNLYMEEAKSQDMMRQVNSPTFQQQISESVKPNNKNLVN